MGRYVSSKGGSGNDCEVAWRNQASRQYVLQRACLVSLLSPTEVPTGLPVWPILLVTEPLIVERVIYLLFLTDVMLTREAAFISLASWSQHCLHVSCVETSIHLPSVISPPPLPRLPPSPLLLCLSRFLRVTHTHRGR